jgi:hypothetical protein
MSEPRNPDPPTGEAPARSAEWLPGWELVALFLGDLITLLMFGVWGQASHDLLRSSAAPFRAVVNTAAPFMLAWLIAAIPTGTYKGTALYPLTRVIWRTVLAGLLAGPLGVVFWALARDHWPAPIFYVVTTGISTSVLLAWRVLWSRLRRSWWPELP